VLSLTAEQMGLDKKNDKNWLWMRNIPDQNWALSATNDHGSVTGKWMDFKSQKDSSPFVLKPPIELASDAGIYYRNRGCWNSVCREESFGEAVWHSNAQAWEDVFGFRNNKRVKFAETGKREDLLGSMNSLEDMTTAACERDANGNCKVREISPGKFEPLPGPRLPMFTGLGSKPFWLLGKSFTYNARSRVDIPADYVNDETGQHIPMKCFLAEGVNAINSNYYGFDPGFYRNSGAYNSSRWEDWVWNSTFDPLIFSGKVCSTEEMGAMLATQGSANEIPVVAVKDCSGSSYWSGDRDGAKRFATFCAGYGYKSANKYRDALGWMVTKARLITVFLGSNYFVVDKYLDQFKPHMDGNLYHMPVVDISQRKCKPKMVGGGSRAATRPAGGVNIPSICGEDMDKLIQSIVPRPEFPLVPETVVRLPEVN
jgi:hypothetical protein